MGVACACKAFSFFEISPPAQKVNHGLDVVAVRSAQHHLLGGGLLGLVPNAELGLGHPLLMRARDQLMVAIASYIAAFSSGESTRPR